MKIGLPGQPLKPVPKIEVSKNFTCCHNDLTCQFPQFWMIFPETAGSLKTKVGGLKRKFRERTYYDIRALV